MEHHVGWLTHLVNHYLGGLALQILQALGITPADSATPIPEHVVMLMTVVVLGSLLALWLRPRLSVENPGGLQQIAEMLLTNPLGFGIRDLLEENAGHAGLKYVPMVGSISVLILLANLLGVIPTFTSPTAQVSVPLGCAAVTFLYFNWQGIRHHGPVGYLKHFAGPIWWLAPLMFPVEIISTSARVLSLTVRLWANIFASDLLYVIFLGLLVQPVLWGLERSAAVAVVLGVFPALIPLAFVGLHIFVSIIQTYVFTLLPAMYIGFATAEEH
jgi:F-type H+-transporting ATPase subunit a